MTKRQKVKAETSPGEEKPGSMSTETAKALLKARETPPSRAEVKVMLNSHARNKARGPERVTAMVANLEVDGKSRVWIGEPHSDKRGWLIRLHDAFGTHSDEFALRQLNYLTNIAAKPNSEGRQEVDPAAANSMLAAVDGTRPRDEIEGQLAVQMATTHAYAMECLMRAQRATLIPQMEASGNLAVKLLRTYTAQVEALAKLRRGGEQKVEVKHVHVHEGGKAIVGNVSHGQGSMGSGSGNEDAPPPSGLDARSLAFAPVAPLWSEEPGREAVPIAGREGEEEMPDARRGQG